MVFLGSVLSSDNDRIWHDGTMMKYNGWVPGEPNDITNEKHSFFDERGWYDVPSYFTYTSLCEKGWLKFSIYCHIACNHTIPYYKYTIPYHTIHTLPYRTATHPIPYRTIQYYPYHIIPYHIPLCTTSLINAIIINHTMLLPSPISIFCQNSSPHYRRL